MHSKRTLHSAAIIGIVSNISVTMEADSNNQFTIAAGRRIDRPAFQKIKSFLFPD